MKKRVLSMLMALALCLSLLPTAALAADPEAAPAEQFSGLTLGETYWFDLSGAGIPGTVNEGNSEGAAAVPDKTLRWVPFTYAGTVKAYVLNENSSGVKTASEAAASTTSPDGQYGYTYDHSLFIADYAVNHKVSWDTLNGEKLIFGKSYNSGGVDYTLRAPSAGSSDDGASGGAPASNEWDMILAKNSVDIKNWNNMYSWGQDTADLVDQYDSSFRPNRGHGSARHWDCSDATIQFAVVGFRPVLEILNPDTLGPDSLTTVTLDLNGGSIGSITGTVNLAVKSDFNLALPGGKDVTRPTGNTGAYFKWQDSNGNFYEPGEPVPANVTRLTALWAPPEQFSLTLGGRYYFDLSGEKIPGTANGNLPDSALHYVPFTYVGTINAYSRNSEGVSTDDTVKPYAHSLFVADYAVTHTVSWDDLNTASLIFGKNYASGGVDYTLRAPSVGSASTGSGDSERIVPQSNEWDTMLNKDDEYIQNWNEMLSWGQDTFSGDASHRAIRGSDSARFWDLTATDSYPYVGFRPVLEVRNPGTLGPDSLTTVTLDLNGGTLGNSSKNIQIIVKNGSTFTAPASDGLTRPAGDTGSYFMWLGSNGKLYAPGDNVPADVTKLTAQFTLSEQFSLTPGGRYYFDLSGEKIPGTANGNLPDSALHYVPFTYVGTINAYSRNSEGVSTDDTVKPYAHSLFVADYNVTHTVSWNYLNTANLIFGKEYQSGGVDYTLRAPSVGSASTGSGDSGPGTPQSNEWDTILDKDNGYIQNWNKMSSWGQDTYSGDASGRAVRGYSSARRWCHDSATIQYAGLGFRPVLEILNPDTLGPDSLTTVTLDLNGGSIGSITGTVNLAVKSDFNLALPGGKDVTRPTGNTGAYFKWQDSSGNFYEPGAQITAGVTSVTRLTARWEKDVPTATANDITVTYTGSAVPDSAITGTASVEGSWSFKNAAPVNVADSSDSVTVVFTPADTNTYETVEDIIKVTINKATPTGTPAYTAITSDGKTLADAALAVGSITPADGSIAWDVADDTVVTANTAYNWTYTPTDGDNYNHLTGSITPYVVSYSGGGSSGSSNTTTKTEKNPDGSTTTTVTDKKTGTVTETTKNTDGSTTVVETKKDGTVTVTNKAADGTTGTVVTDKNGDITEVKSNVSSTAAKEAEKSGGAVTLPVEVPAAKTTGDAPAVEVTVPKSTGSVKVEIPVEKVTPGTVAVIVKADGTEEIVKTSIPTKTGVALKLEGSATVKVIDNAKKFSDVPASHWAGEAVAFASARGITGGTSDTTFSPDTPCTRGQIVTFLWRAAGSPEPKGLSSLSDVPADAYYAKAVAWALENGITGGTGNGMFSPDATCTRSQSVTFLYRAAGSPKASGSSVFSDIAADSYYADAVAWAAQNDITGGIGSGLFGPANECSRAQIVTFLWRAMAE